METVIRLAKIEDAPLIAAVESKCFTTPESEASVVSVIENSVYEAFVLETDGNIVGHTITMTTCGDTDILSIAVLPSFRRMGLGKMLMENIVKSAEKHGVSDIFLEVRKSNTSAISLYEKFGFEKIGERKNFYDLPREDAFLMRKIIIKE